MNRRRKPQRKKRAATPVTPPRIYQLHDLLTDREAAEFLRVRAHTLRVWRTADRQPAPRFTRIHRLIRYQFSDLLDYVQRCKPETTAA